MYGTYNMYYYYQHFMVLFQHFCHQRKYCSRTNKDIADVDSALTWDTDYVMYDTLDAWRT